MEDKQPHSMEATAIRDVLVVDDSLPQRRLISVMLRQWGYQVREAETGHAAIAACRDHAPDLVLSDWMMPGMDGIEFCREFKKMERDSYGYFILLTSKKDKQDIATGLDAGADDFLTKPVNPSELRARLAAGERILRMEEELTKKNRLIRSTLDELQGLYDTIHGDLVEARKLQHSLVRERLHDFGLARVSLILRASGHVGGDLVGCYPVSDTRIGIFGLDVSGHGISSALMTARIAGHFSANLPEHNIAMRRMADGTFQHGDPSETAKLLNDKILSEISTDHYLTLLLAEVDLLSGTVRFVQAGHPPIVIRRASGEIEAIGDGGLPVGLMPNARYQTGNARLEPGDKLLIHSDGLTECRTPDGACLGDAGLMEMLDGLGDMTGPGFLDALIWRLADFAGGDEFDDDVSALLLEFR